MPHADPVAVRHRSKEREWLLQYFERYRTSLFQVDVIGDLIQLKRLAGRPQDLADIEALEIILRRKEARGGG